MEMQYQGHRSWNAWNVSLWINNDEPMYGRAVEMVRKYGRTGASYRLSTEWTGKTPDGANFNRTCIYEALEGME
jgi:hypothetical protein